MLVWGVYRGGHVRMDVLGKNRESPTGHPGPSEAIRVLLMSTSQWAARPADPPVVPSPVPECEIGLACVNSWPNPPFGSLPCGVFTLHNREGGVEAQETSSTAANVIGRREELQSRATHPQRREGHRNGGSHHILVRSAVEPL